MQHISQKRYSYYTQYTMTQKKETIRRKCRFFKKDIVKIVN